MCVSICYTTKKRATTSIRAQSYRTVRTMLRTVHNCWQLMRREIIILSLLRFWAREMNGRRKSPLSHGEGALRSLCLIDTTHTPNEPKTVLRSVFDTYETNRRAQFSDGREVRIRSRVPAVDQTGRVRQTRRARAIHLMLYTVVN